MRYSINNENLNRLYGKIKKELIERTEIINELLKIDYKYCKIKINIQMLIDLMDRFSEEKIDIQEEKRILIKYSGNPYITLNLCIIAILTKSTILLEFNEYMLGINTLIIEVINESLKYFNTDNLIYLNSKKDTEDIDKIICIDDINEYNAYLREKNTKVRFYSLYYMDYYTDTDEFEELEDLIYEFAENNLIPIEGYSELYVDNAIELMKKGIGQSIVILTNNKQTQEAIEKNIKNKKIYINKNPFEEKIKVIKKDIILL